MDVDYWKHKTLEQMNQQEWEALCDGCALCCLQKLQDDETDEVFYTCIACEQLDLLSGKCKNYQQRLKLVNDCVKITLDNVEEFRWLPHSCAYRTLAEGRPLQPWHPLVSGSDESVHEAGISVRGKVIPQHQVPPEEWEDYIINWVQM